MDDYVALNRDLWNELADIHAQSKFYDVEGFKRGDIKLRDYEIAEVGDVSGKTLLHLMCHIGIDTLSWARLGAKVTGADLSERSVEFADGLARELGIDATFVASDVYDLPSRLEGEFDLVYMSRGVFGWLPDLRRWARVVAHFLRPGGRFYATEIHPLAQIFYDKEGTTELTIGYPYFSHREPMRFINKGSYADREADLTHVLSFVWPHDMGDIVTSLADVGLHIDFLNEFPFTDWEKPWLMRDDDGMWRLPDDFTGEFPLSFSVGATKQ